MAGLFATVGRFRSPAAHVPGVCLGASVENNSGYLGHRGLSATQTRPVPWHHPTTLLIALADCQLSKAQYPFAWKQNDIGKQTISV